jgi:hypothetical protein
VETIFNTKYYTSTLQVYEKMEMGMVILTIVIVSTRTLKFNTLNSRENGKKRIF